MLPTESPVVLCFSGHDATAGAGLSADITTLLSLTCHPATVATCITVQDTVDVKNFMPLPSTLVKAQAQALLADMSIAAIKIGMIGSVKNVEAIHALLGNYPHVPVVLDPILWAGGGSPLAEEDLSEALIELLLPLATVITPNSQEARTLSPTADTLDACAHQILAQGCQSVLITGAHEPTPQVINTFYRNNYLKERFTWPRLPQVYHGSGCTLASAIAGLLAKGLAPQAAVQTAQAFTWYSLCHGYRVGMGQFIPDRLFWATRGNSFIN